LGVKLSYTMAGGRLAFRRIARRLGPIICTPFPRLLPTTRKKFLPIANEADFQERILRALEPGPKRRLFVVLNSAFFLWTLTAILLTLGGAFASRRSECILAFEKFKEDWIPLSEEVGGRQDDIMFAILRAEDPNELASKMAEIKGTFSTFKHQGLRELLKRQQTLAGNIDFEDYFRASTALGYIIGKVAREQKIDLETVNLLKSIYFGWNEEAITAEKLIDLKRLAAFQMSEYLPSSGDGADSKIVPNCGPSALWRDLFSDRRHFVRISPPGGVLGYQRVKIPATVRVIE